MVRGASHRYGPRAVSDARQPAGTVLIAPPAEADVAVMGLGYVGLTVGVVLARSEPDPEPTPSRLI